MTGGERRPLMQPVEWKALEAVLDAALDRPESERAAFVAAACAGNVAMQAKIERLLRDCARSDGWLERPAFELFSSLLDDDPSLPPELPAMLADRFRLERELGRGGMGVVYLARDLKHDREVAVKVMRSAVRANVGAARFLREIRTTAKLHHPNIVPLYDSGDSPTGMFFVMPFVDGESLGARLARGGALPVDEAVRIASDVATALAHAHANGVVHRDVKPTNVMLSDGRALLADFGIARVESVAGGAATETGVPIGTPAYMSPEQLSPGRAIDARSDVYSLGCVLYEMIAGKRPSPASLRVATAAHGVDPVVPVGDGRDDVPRALSECVARAMAIDPAQRFASAAAFRGSLDDAKHATPEPSARVSIAPRRWTRRRIATWVGVGAALLSAGFAWRLASRPTRVASVVVAGAPAVDPSTTVAVDTTVYILFPFDSAPDVTSTFSAGARLRDALHQWDRITVLDDADAGIQAALRRHGPSHLLAAEAVAIARERRAGRFILSDVSLRDSGTYVYAGVYDTSGRTLHYATARLPRAARDLDAAFSDFALALLFPDLPADIRSSGSRATNSRPALQAFARGREEIDRWDLARADSALTLAQSYDARFARADAWLAQVHYWQRASQAVWRPEVMRASSHRDALSPREGIMVDALLAQARGDIPAACASWRSLADGDATDFAAWYSLVRCQMSDHLVVRDARSPSGWAFRTSYQQVALSFQKAFDALPSAHVAFRESWYRDLRTLLRLSTQLRAGASAAPSSVQFQAYPSWSGDTLAYVPYPAADFALGQPWTVSSTYRDAIVHQRSMALEILTSWRHAFQKSPEALLSLGIALDGLGYTSALDSVQAARRLATRADDSVRTGAVEVWMTVKRSLPADLRGLDRARILADSLLRLHPAATGPTAGVLASLAALVGHADRAAALARAAGRADARAPQLGIGAAQALLVYAAMGGPPDSLRALEREVSEGIRRSVPDSTQAEVRERWLTRAATIAFPDYRFATVTSPGDSSDFLSMAQTAWRRRDSLGVRRAIDRLPRARRSLLVEGLRFEVLYPEASLLASIGDVDGAIARMGPTLDAQAKMSLERLPDEVDAGALVRAMRLRAELARRSGDTAAAERWSDAVATLWSDADPLVRESAGLSMPVAARIGYWWRRLFGRDAPASARTP